MNPGRHGIYIGKRSRTESCMKVQNKWITVGIPMVKCLLCACIVTALLLMLLALFLYKLRLPDAAVSIVIIVIYVAASLLAGLLAGKCMQKRRFLWGMLEGCCYFLLLLVISMAVAGKAIAPDTDMITTFLLCLAGGTLGGMIS